jgi:hypothetical protein
MSKILESIEGMESLTPVQGKVTKSSFLIVPARVGKMAEFSPYTCISENAVLPYNLAGDCERISLARLKGESKAIARVFGATEKILERFPVVVDEESGAEFEVKPAPWVIKAREQKQEALQMVEAEELKKAEAKKVAAKKKAEKKVADEKAKADLEKNGANDGKKDSD